VFILDGSQPGGTGFRAARISHLRISQKTKSLFPSPWQFFRHAAKLFEPRDTIESVVIHSCRDGAGYQLRAVFHSEVFHA
jgi:hypothetical protein